MTNNPTKEKFITEAVFKVEIKSLHQKIDVSVDSLEKRLDGVDKRFQGVDKRFQGVDKRFDAVDEKLDHLDKKIDSSVARLDKKIDNVALALIKTNDRLERVENTMSTKSDINLILDRIDHLFKKEVEFDQEERVQSFQLQDVRRKVNDHEKRIVFLETSK